MRLPRPAIVSALPALFASASALALDPVRTPPLTAKEVTTPSLRLGGAITCTSGPCDASGVSATPNSSAAAGTIAKLFADRAPLAGPAFTGPTKFDPMNLLNIRPDITNRGPLFVWNNPDGSNAVGVNAGFQVWIGDNPTATPGAGDTVGGTVVVNNGNNRSRLFEMNIFNRTCSNTICGAGYNNASSTGLEIEVGTDYAANSTDPWGGAFRKNGLELVSQSNNVGRPTSGMMIWANDNSGTGWMHTGIGISRVWDVGIRAKANPNDSTAGGGPGNADAVNAFQTAFILDESNSANVLKVGPGTHNSVIDLSTATTPGYFVKGSATAGTILSFGNAANQNMVLAIDSGNSAAAASELYFGGRGSTKWIIGKDNSTAFRLFNAVSGAAPITIPAGTDVVTMPKAHVTGSLVLPSYTVATLAWAAGGVWKCSPRSVPAGADKDWLSCTKALVMPSSAN